MWLRSDRIWQSLAIETPSAQTDHVERRSWHRRQLRGVAIVIVQQTAEPLAAFHLPDDLPDFLSWIDDLVVEPLVISLGVIMVQELVDSIVQRLLAEEDHSVQAFGFDTSHEAFQMGIQVGTLGRQSHRFDAFV